METKKSEIKNVSLDDGAQSEGPSGKLAGVFEVLGEKVASLVSPEKNEVSQTSVKKDGPPTAYYSSCGLTESAENFRRAGREPLSSSPSFFTPKI